MAGDIGQLPDRRRVEFIERLDPGQNTVQIADHGVQTLVGNINSRQTRDLANGGLVGDMARPKTTGRRHTGRTPPKTRRKVSPAMAIFKPSDLRAAVPEGGRLLGLDLGEHHRLAVSDGGWR